MEAMAHNNSSDSLNGRLLIKGSTSALKTATVEMVLMAMDVFANLTELYQSNQ